MEKSNMRRGTSLLAAVSAPFLLTAVVRAQEPVALKIAAPELNGIEEWINSKPFALKDIKGKVIVLHFWTFG
jgi:hypothetical protein